MSEAFEANYSRGHSIQLGLGCLAFVLVGLMLIGVLISNVPKAAGFQSGLLP